MGIVTSNVAHLGAIAATSTLSAQTTSIEDDAEDSPIPTLGVIGYEGHQRGSKRHSRIKSGTSKFLKREISNDNRNQTSGYYGSSGIPDQPGSVL
jgi:hypothetical protein